MPKKPEQNAQVRAERGRQILDAALTVYIRCGYHGTDMDEVAREAGLAKGLVYYYYKTKKELFVALYTHMSEVSFAFSEALLKNAAGYTPLEQLMYYAYGMFNANKDSPRMMQFNIRSPFDAYAVFAPGTWQNGVKHSDLHKEALAEILRAGMAQGLVPQTDPRRAANSFWTVFVANLFEYAKLMSGEQPPFENDTDALRETVRFCFQGLGVEASVWQGCLAKIMCADREGDPVYEGL